MKWLFWKQNQEFGETRRQGKEGTYILGTGLFTREVSQAGRGRDVSIYMEGRIIGREIWNLQLGAWSWYKAELGEWLMCLKQQWWVSTAAGWRMDWQAWEVWLPGRLAQQDPVWIGCWWHAIEPRQRCYRDRIHVFQLCLQAPLRPSKSSYEWWSTSFCLFP